MNPTQNQPDPRAPRTAVTGINPDHDRLCAVLAEVVTIDENHRLDLLVGGYERIVEAIQPQLTAKNYKPEDEARTYQAYEVAPAPADPQAIANAEKITRLRAAIENAIYGNGEDRMLDPVFVGRILSAVVPFVALASAPSAHSAIARELAVLPALHAVHEIQTLTRLWIEADEEAKAAEIVLKQFLPTIARLVEENKRLKDKYESNA